MSANIELALLTRVMEENEFHLLEKARITEEFFFTPESREVFRFLRDTFHAPQTAGQIPTIELARYRFPTLYFGSPPDAVVVLIEQLRQEKIRVELLTMAQTIQERAGFDTAAAIAEARQRFQEIATISEAGEDLSMASAFGILRDQYESVQGSGGLLGIPFPWDALNEETQGMQNGQFIIFFGRPKTMKTWLAVHTACHAYTHSRRRVLFYTREMTPKLVAGRVAATIARVNYKAFKNGTLQPEHKERVFRILSELGDDEKLAGSAGTTQPWFTITTDRGRSGTGSGGVGWLGAKIRELKPDLVVVDGMYLMKDDRSNTRSVDWKNVAHISQDIKLMCQEFDIPIIGVTQGNRGGQKSKGEDLTELSFSDSLGQDADAVLKTSLKKRIDDQGRTRTELALTAPGLREGQFDGIILNAEPGVNFDFIRKMIPEDFESDDYSDKPKRGGPNHGSPSFRGGGRTLAQQEPRPNHTYMRP